MLKVQLASKEYIQSQAMLHLDRPSYGTSGGKWAQIVKASPYKDVLDYGCGKGMLAEALDFPIQEYDPGMPGKNRQPVPAKLVMCTDVLEHIEPEYLDNVLQHIRSLMKREAFFVIATRPAQKTLPDGRNAHLTVEPMEWWLEKLGKYFQIKETKENISEEGEFAVVVGHKT